MLLHEDKVTQNHDAFIAKVNQISNDLQINPNWLMQVMYSESQLRPDITNPDGGATGLIQFMPDTAAGLGTSTAALKQMSNVDQLDYVYQYFKPYKNYITKFADLYLINLYPNADHKFAGTLSKPSDWQFPAGVVKQNKGIDLNSDGTISIAEFIDWAFSKVPSDWVDNFKNKTVAATVLVEKKVAATVQSHKTAAIIIIGSAVLLLTAAIIIKLKK